MLVTVNSFSPSVTAQRHWRSLQLLRGFWSTRSTGKKLFKTSSSHVHSARKAQVPCKTETSSCLIIFIRWPWSANENHKLEKTTLNQKINQLNKKQHWIKKENKSIESKKKTNQLNLKTQHWIRKEKINIESKDNSESDINYLYIYQWLNSMHSLEMLSAFLWPSWI